ncbi:hypothetical protein [Vibrio harveyi]|uniref:hypothetical protein n=1 Tax=Vibrio harveyi TaxID=669 RepID=UPI002380A0C6|nr:hypothetical protein [Vibrio harveyi]
MRWLTRFPTLTAAALVVLWITGLYIIPLWAGMAYGVVYGLYRLGRYAYDNLFLRRI